MKTINDLIQHYLKLQKQNYETIIISQVIQDLTFLRRQNFRERKNKKITQNVKQ